MSIVIDPANCAGVVLDLDAVLTEPGGQVVDDAVVELVVRLRLRGIPVGLVSSGRDAGAQVAERAGLGELLAAVGAGPEAPADDDDGRVEGPTDGGGGASIRLEVARRMDVDPAQAVFVAATPDGAAAGRRDGFGQVVDVATVEGLAQVVVRAGERPLSRVPDAATRWEMLERLLRARRPVVFLDFDGTLAPIVDDPDDAAAPPEMRDAVERLARTCTVAIVSGRDLSDVQGRIAADGLWFAGSHGFELAGPDGEYHEQQVVGDMMPALDAAESELRAELADEPGVRVERKNFALAVHTRGADDDVAERAVSAVERVGADGPLRVTEGRAVTELRPDVDWDKGAAVRWLLDNLGEGDGGADDRPTLAVYAGDDLTDEDALRAVQEHGLGIVVVNDEHGDRPTLAHVAVDGPEGLLGLLERLASTLDTTAI